MVPRMGLIERLPALVLEIMLPSRRCRRIRTQPPIWTVVPPSTQTRRSTTEPPGENSEHRFLVLVLGSESQSM